MVNRRQFLQAGLITSTTASLLDSKAETFDRGGRGYSRISGIELESIPSVCTLCDSRCPTSVYLDEGRVVKVEGLSESNRTKGRLCARGQAIVNQVYDPDRILSPMKRVGARGEGQWEKISWEEALVNISERIKALQSRDAMDRFLFHYGDVSIGSEQFLNGLFFPKLGSATIAKDSATHNLAKDAALNVTLGYQHEHIDFDHCRYILNFGSNVLESDRDLVANSQRLIEAIDSRGVRMITFDVRLSNTAAKSSQWLHVNPGTDGAVALALCHVILSENLLSKEAEELLNFCQVSDDHAIPLSEKILILKAHLKQYSPRWAERVSGVSASLIKTIAREIVANSPVAIISGGGIRKHSNGFETERAILLLSVLSGNLQRSGSRTRAVLPNWQFASLANPDETAIASNDAYINDQVLHQIANEEISTPEIYCWFNLNPILRSPNVAANRDLLKDEKSLPFTIAVTNKYDESAALADLILPQTHSLEEYDIDFAATQDQFAEYSIRQPVVEPAGEALDFITVCCQLAEKLDMDLEIETGEDYVRLCCENTPEVEDDLGGFDVLTQLGTWEYEGANHNVSYFKEEIEPSILEGAYFDNNSGTYWQSKADFDAFSSNGVKEISEESYGYLGQVIGDNVYQGFMPTTSKKSGLIELYAQVQPESGDASLPIYGSINSYNDMDDDELYLIPFNTNVQTASVTQNCKWLNEISDQNYVWINPVTADKHGIKQGDLIKLTTNVGTIETIAKSTQLIMPGVVALANLGGHWQSGRFASGNKAPFAPQSNGISSDDNPWWLYQQLPDVHPNWLISSTKASFTGQQCWNDSVVRINKA